jgi:transposase-like protein
MTDTTTTQPPLKDLGFANGWSSIPYLVSYCPPEHHRIVKNEGRCLTRVTCKECGYTYLVDSSD